MNKKISQIILLCFSIIIALVIGIYFYINIVYIPKTVIPLLKNSTRNQTGLIFSTENIILTPTGKIKVSTPIIYKENSQVPLISCETIYISTSYRKLLPSILKKSDILNTPLTVIFISIKATPPSTNITGDITAKLNLSINKKLPEQSKYKGKIILDNFKISNIPGVGTIKKIKGILEVTEENIALTKLNGRINGIPINLTGTLENFNNPQITLNADLPPFNISMECLLSKNNLTISKVEAAYNNTKLTLTGTLKDINSSVLSELSANLNIDLTDLLKLPLEIQPILLLLNPQGKINADLKISGPLKKAADLEGQLQVESNSISISEYSIQSLKINGSLRQGIANLEKLKRS